jgi:hypothetical protein
MSRKTSLFRIAILIATVRARNHEKGSLSLRSRREGIPVSG